MRCGHSFKVSVRTLNKHLASRGFVRILAVHDDDRKNNECLLEQTQKFNATDSHLFDFAIPDQRWPFGQFELQIQFKQIDSDDEILEKHVEVRLHSAAQICLIQLDKPLYRPNETVNARLLLLNAPSLLPRSDTPITVNFKVILVDLFRATFQLQLGTAHHISLIQYGWTFGTKINCFASLF
jgi:hypothetical protein